MVSGFELSVYDVRALSRSIAAETDSVGERVRDLRESSVDRTDFGSDDQDGIGAGYVRAVHGTFVDALLDVRSAGERFAAELNELTQRYESAEDDVTALLSALEQRFPEAGGE